MPTAAVDREVVKTTTIIALEAATSSYTAIASTHRGTSKSDLHISARTLLFRYPLHTYTASTITFEIRWLLLLLLRLLFTLVGRMLTSSHRLQLPKWRLL